MGEPLNEKNSIIFRRWGVVVSILALISSVVFGVLEFTNAISDENSTNSAGLSSSTTTGSQPNAPNTIEEEQGQQRPSSTPSLTDTIVLGSDVPTVRQDDCHTPSLASGSSWQPGPVQFGGRTFDDGYWCNIFSGGIGSLQFALDGGYQELTLTIGFLPDSEALGHEVRFEIIGDGDKHLIEPRVLALRDVIDLRVGVAGTFRLSLEVSEVGDDESATGQGPSKPVWAGLVLTPA